MARRYAVRSPGANVVTRRWSTLTQSGVVAGSSRRLSAAYVPLDKRPCVRVRGRFAGEVPGVEFLEGGVDVVGVECDAGHDSFVGVDLDDVEQLVIERVGRWSSPTDRTRLRARRSPRVAMAVDVIFVAPTSAVACASGDYGISTLSDPGVHNPTAIVVEMRRRPAPRSWRPSRGPRSTSTGRRSYSACGVFQTASGGLSSSNLASAASRSASSNSSVD